MHTPNFLVCKKFALGNYLLVSINVHRMYFAPLQRPQDRQLIHTMPHGGGHTGGGGGYHGGGFHHHHHHRHHRSFGYGAAYVNTGGLYYRYGYVCIASERTGMLLRVS